MLTRLADIIAKRWREPDNGIWEKRSGRKQHVHAKVMAWAALDCAARVLGDEDRWARERDDIKREVLERGFNTSLNSFVSEYGGDELDASLLYISRVGFIDADDPRVRSARRQADDRVPAALRAGQSRGRQDCILGATRRPAHFLFCFFAAGG